MGTVSKPVIPANGWAGWILMGVVMVVFWAVVITLVILAVRYLTTDRGARPAHRYPGHAAPRICWPNASPAARSTTTNIGGA